jgi:hypothetical protein
VALASEILVDYLKMLIFYTDYWIKHRSLLLEGEFSPLYPLANYPQISVYKNGHQITAIYSDEVIFLAPKPSLNNFDIITPSKKQSLSL